MRSKWKYVKELLISASYSMGGSLGLLCIANWMAMELDSHLQFPYRRPIVLALGLLALLCCIVLLGYDLSRERLWKWWQTLLCRLMIIALSFEGFLMLWSFLFLVGDSWIGTD